MRGTETSQGPYEQGTARLFAFGVGWGVMSSGEGGKAKLEFCGPVNFVAENGNPWCTGGMCDCQQSEDSESIRRAEVRAVRMMGEMEHRMGMQLRGILREAEEERLGGRIVLAVVVLMLGLVILAFSAGVKEPEQVNGTVPVGTTP